MNIVVVGATSAIAQSCIDIWSRQGNHEFVLTGRNKAKLISAVSDLEIRFTGSKFTTEYFDHLNAGESEVFVNKYSSQNVDLVLIAHGSLTSQNKASLDIDYLWKELETNALSPISFAELWAGVLERQGHGSLAVIGSVSGDRGRAINHGYGSGKAAIETYLSGLQHRLAGTKVQVSLIKPGPTRTPMTIEAHVGPSKLADPDVVAKQIVEGIAKGKRVIYAPKQWRYIMLVIKLLPFRLFKKLTF